MRRIIPVILAGRVGIKIWPKFFTHHPKQSILPLSDKTMLGETIIFLDNGLQIETIFVCNEDIRFLVVQLIKSLRLHDIQIVLVSSRKNTPLNIGLAALTFSRCLVNILPFWVNHITHEEGIIL